MSHTSRKKNARKKNFTASFAAIAVTATLTFFAANGSGAVAQDALETPRLQLPEAELTGERVPVATPVFVSEEIVQPVSETTEQDDEPESTSANIDAASLHELVGEMPRQSELSPEMECLAGAVYFEARGEPLDGQLAVAQVIINRSEDRAFPSSYCGVVYQRSQFSFVKGGKMPSIKRSSAAWTKAKAIAKIAHEGTWESPADDSLYFHAKYVKPSWSRSKIARATIDTHIFYR
ncbi:cell wall hydrolase [Altererythrobacter sp. SALINAS58]|uniref:cell wall hydrolase n=1 Tax=Alteripontixanthobacter muriae TaxID=2705546 RepID=UPI001576B5B5|nr:cell wall hydrolase [Alteripontixanthobacter muriae]NTZ43543.1 cell wall hydrolase [Alteripontixanthobacter muriae]